MRMLLLSMWLGVLLVIGCQSNSTAPVVEKKAAVKQNDHSAWWCAEHGIPEEECSRCSAKVAREFKAKGDWCEMHDRAKSQCFQCDPKLSEKFAAKYRAKYNAEPPAITED